MKLTMGLDWSEAHHDVCVLDPHGRQIAAFQISHTSRGFLKLAEQIDQLGLPKAEIGIGVETAHKLVVDFLLSRDYTVYIIAPRQSQPGTVSLEWGTYGSE